jgi:adenylate kinase family enzyme
MYGRHLQRNAVHASASAKDARHEIAFFFPHVVRNPLPDREETQDFLLRKSVAARSKLTEVQAGIGFDIEPSLLQFVSSGLVSLCQTRPHGDMKNLDALQYLADWLQENNPNNPKLDEPAVEIPVGVAPQTNAEGVAFTIEEPADDIPGPEVVEIDVSQEKTDKFLAEFETPPMVLLAIGGDDVLPDIAEKGGFMLLDVNELVAEEGKSGGRGAIGKEIARKLAGGLEVDIKLKLPLLRYQMLENADVGRFIVSGLSTAQEMILFEQEVTEATIVLCAASAETESDLLNSERVVKIKQYYTPTAKYRTVEDAPDRAQAAVTMMLPKVLYLLGASGSGKAAIAEQLELEYGYCHINVPSLLKKLAKEPTAVGKSVAASIEAGELVDKAIVGPEIVDQMRGARRFGFTTFVLCGFPRSVEQLRFFESQMECVSEALVVDYPRADVVELALAQNSVRDARLTQDIVEKTVGAFYGADTDAVVSALKDGPCAQVQKVALTLQNSAKQAWSAVTPLIRPRVTVIMGPPGSQDLSDFAALYAGNQAQATLLDVDALLDSELERRTEIGVQMANMLARGQVIPVRMILEVVKKACRWTNSPALVLEKFPRFLDEAELLAQHFTVDRVILAEVSEAKHMAAQEAQGDAYAERWNRTLQVAQYFSTSGLLVKVEMEDVKGKQSSTELALLQATKAARPKCIAIVGMPFVGTTDLANLLRSRNGFAVIGKENVTVDPAVEPKERARATVAQIDQQLSSTTASIVVLDDLLTDHETYLAFEEAFGAPSVLHLTASPEALAARAADAMKDADDTDVQPMLDAAKEALEAPGHYLNQGLPTVYKIETPEGEELSKEEFSSNLANEATQKLQPQVHVVVGPSVRDASLTLATVLAQKAAGKQVILDAKELATPSPRYSSDLNAALQNAKACGEPLLPDVWAQVFAQRMPEFPLQHLFLVNFPTGGVSAFPTVRDELEVLSQYAVLKGVIVAEFSEEALRKYCYKGAPKAPQTAGEALALFRGDPVSDAQAYTSELELRSAYLDALNMDRPKWLTPLTIDGTSGTLAEVAQDAAKSVLAALDLA